MWPFLWNALNVSISRQIVKAHRILIMSSNSSLVTDYDVDASFEQRIVVTIVLIVLIIAGICGNVAIWVTVLSCPKLRTVTNTFVLSLCAVDLLVLTIPMPLTTWTLVQGKWTLPGSICMFLGYVTMFSLVSSVLSLWNISLNRYIMVCRPFYVSTIYTQRTVGCMIAAALVVSAVLASPPLFGWGNYTFLPSQAVCFCDWRADKSYAFFMIVTCFGGPFSVMLICNVQILRTVRRSQNRVSAVLKVTPDVPAISKNTSTQRHLIVPSSHVSKHGRLSNVSIGGAPDRKSAFRKSRSISREGFLELSLAVIVVVFVICWLPYCISMVLSMYNTLQVPSAFHMASILFGYFNSCCNPFIYGVMNKQLGARFYVLICRFCCRKKKSVEIASNTDASNEK